MGQFIFSGAPNHMNFDFVNEIEYTIGFGNATRYIAQEFNKNGLYFIQGKYQNNFPDNMVNLAFCYPDEFNFFRRQYKIGYMPWESTQLHHGWAETLNQCDEVWTTSDWSQNVLQNLLNVPVHIYEHGIPDFCIPYKRKRKKVFRFLHIGEPALRKGGQDVVDSFIKLFGNDPNYQLVLKSSGPNTTRIYDKNNVSIGTPPSIYKNIIIVEDQLPEAYLMDLYRKTDALVYPSYGEGFGFNAAYAVATSMPAICTAEWAPYRDFLVAPLDSTYIDSPWPKHHPGQVIQPDLEQMENYMIDVSENYDRYLKDTWSNAIGIHEKFSWQAVSRKPIARLKKIISMTSK